MTKKKYVISMYVDMTNIPPEKAEDHLKLLKSECTNETFSKFLESDVMCFWFPIYTESRIEVKEIVIES